MFQSAGGFFNFFYLFQTFGYSSLLILVKSKPPSYMQTCLSLCLKSCFTYKRITETKKKAILTSVCLQGSRVCAGEAFRKLAERRTRLGDFEEPLLGHAYPSLGQRRLWGGEENTKHTNTHLLCFHRVLNASNVSLYSAEITQFVCVMTKYQVSYSSLSELIAALAALTNQSGLSMREHNWKVELSITLTFIYHRN